MSLLRHGGRLVKNCECANAITLILAGLIALQGRERKGKGERGLIVSHFTFRVDLTSWHMHSSQPWSLYYSFIALSCNCYYMNKFKGGPILTEISTQSYDEIQPLRVDDRRSRTHNMPLWWKVDYSSCHVYRICRICLRLKAVSSVDGLKVLYRGLIIISRHRQVLVNVWSACRAKRVQVAPRDRRTHLLYHP